MGGSCPGLECPDGTCFPCRFPGGPGGGGAGDPRGGVDRTGVAGDQPDPTNTGGNNNPPPPPPPPGGCSLMLEPMAGKPPLRCVGVWSPDTTNTDTTDDWDDLPAVKATGGGAGGTYTWEVLQGGAMIQLVSPSFAGGGAPTPPGTDDDSVRILGVAPSAALNDVKIKATWRSADGTQECSDMLELTVIAATLSFRPANPLAQPRQQWSQNNEVNAQLFSDSGTPTLGFVSPNSPPGTLGFHKNMEIRAEIQPCIDGLECEFDFKRERQGRIGILLANPQGGPVFSPGPGDCAPPQWCDDDTPADPQDPTSINLDEDLSMAPEDCDLFVIDTPGVATAGSTCALLQAAAQQQGFEFRSLINAMDFHEWLNIDGWRASQTLPWHGATEISCAEGAFVETNFEFGNVLGTGVLPVPEQGAGRPDLSWVELGDFDFENIIKLIHQWDDSPDRPTDPTDRAGILRSLERVAAGRSKKVQDNPPEFFSPRTRAINLLGRLRASESVDTLLDLLDFKVINRWSPPPAEYRPAVGALISIGEHVIAPILERCGSESAERWRLMARVLRRIDQDSPLVRQAMRTMLDAQAWFAEVEAAGAAPQPSEAERARRARVKERLLEFLSTPEPDRPTPVISALPRPLERVTAVAR